MNETADTSDTARTEQRRRRLRDRWIGGIVLIFALGLIGYGTYWILVSRFYVSTDDAYVAGNRLPLTPQIAGTVVAIRADDTDRVQAGQAVVTIDHSNQEIALNHAEAALGGAVRQVRQLHQQEDAARAGIALRGAELAQARRDDLRDQHLIAIHGVTQERFQHAQTAYQSAQQELIRARHQLAVLQTQTDAPSLRQIPQVQRAIANLHRAWLDLKRTEILAPASGYVAQRSVQIGQRVTPGQPLLSIVPLQQIWVDANFKETQLKRVRLGQPVKLTADQYGSGVVYHGCVAGLSAGTGSAFELLPPQNATGNWIKIVRRVPVRIRLQPDEIEKHPLRIGLSMAVTIDAHDTGSKVLASAPPPKAVYSTDVYRRQQSGFETLVEKILRENGVSADVAAGNAS
ncbi:MAG: efflux RND transporter periplasmic adaptor subunit [Gammaproteobacteria bacterium]|nr:efflux RND transporter periplasmic adaptor subunit [Gammaproteobacteria bacterium]